MRVGVNLLWLRPGLVGGTETYVTRLLAGLAESSPADVQLHLLALPGFGEAHPDLAKAFPISSPMLPMPSRALRVAAEQTWIPERRLRLKLDVIHHAGGTAPLIGMGPSLTTIYDLQYLTYPETFDRVKLAFLGRFVPAAIRHSRVVVTISEFVRSTIIDGFGLEPDRVHVVDPVMPAVPERPEAEVKAALDRLLPSARPFALYPAIGYPHKNHEVLVRALTATSGFDLVFTGAPWPHDETVDRLAAQLGVADRVRRLGYVSGADLDALYRGAEALVYPSRYEGFGMAAIEAMARDCPVLVAEGTALPEAVADAGVVLPVNDPEAWGAAIVAVIADGAARKRLIKAGRERVASLSAANGAEAQIRAYRKALET